jgi:uncharacterized protein (TIGR02271 family)
MKTVVGVFPNAREAQLTADELEEIGLARNDITFVDKSSVASDDLIQQLTSYGVPDQTARQYVDSINRGGTLESVRVRDEQVDEALTIMRRHTSELGGTGRTTAKTGKVRGSNLGAETSDETISVLGEELIVGKRELERGGVKVTSRVVEEPVSKDVQLREERVTVERQPVDREIDPENADFREQTIEMRETSETPVVVKRARVIEEIKLHKDIVQRTENVKGTVRKMNVDVQKIGARDDDLRPFDSSDYEGHYQQLGDRNADFRDYEPAYKFGHEMREDSRFQGETWDEVEPRARDAWEERNPNTWERFKASVRHAWDRVK